MRALTLSFCCAVLAGCQTGLVLWNEPRPAPASAPADQKSLQAQLRACRAVTIGMPIDAAEKLLRESGFACVRWPDGGKGARLECQASAADGTPPGTTLLVRLYYADGKITGREIKGRVATDLPGSRGLEWEFDQEPHTFPPQPPEPPPAERKPGAAWLSAFRLDFLLPQKQSEPAKKTE